MSASTAPISKSGLYADPREDWLARRTEEVIDPARPIVDPHHHLWERGGLRYMIEEMAEGVLVVDRRGRVRAINPAARKLLAERAALLPNERARERFLRQVPYHQAILCDRPGNMPMS